MLENAWEQNGLQVHFDWGVFAFTAAITIATGILFGLAPALAAARRKCKPRIEVRGADSDATPQRIGRQSAGRIPDCAFDAAGDRRGTFSANAGWADAVDVGFRTDHLLLVEISPDRTQYPPGKDIELHQRLAAAFAAVPGVKAVTSAQAVYIADSRIGRNFVVQGKNAHTPIWLSTTTWSVTISSRHSEFRSSPGAGFGPQDTATSLKVGVINQSLARKAFPNENPIGKRFGISRRGRATAAPSKCGPKLLASAPIRAMQIFAYRAAAAILSAICPAARSGRAEL